MIDCEAEIYGRISETLQEAFSNINVSGEYVRTPSSFPHVSVVMSDCAPIRNCLDSSDDENMALATFEINVYSALESGRKTECRKIMQIIDKVMFGCNANRMALTPVPNLEDATIYRLTARYRVQTDGKYFYRR